MSEITQVEKINILAGAVYAAADIGMWCFDMDRNPFYSTCPYEKEFRMFLEIGGCLDYAYARKGGCERPMILSDSTGLMWVAETMYKEGKPDLMFVMGPVFMSSTSIKSIEEALNEKELSIAMKKQMMRMLSNVPVVIRSMMNQYSAMLHFILTEEKISPKDFIYPEEIIEENEALEVESNSSDAERVAKGEKLILQAIREGNLNYLQVIDDEGDKGDVNITHTGNNLRDSKNTLLIFCALCCRAAMEGGVPAKTAKEMEKRYIAKIEASESMEVLINLNLSMMNECVRRVHDGQQNPEISSVVRESCDYVRANVLKPLTVEMIAAEMGYTEYYFTKKFYKEMGMRLTDYIKQARIEYAKVSLITTKKSIQDISDSLHFGTRNYFSKVFRDIVGVTPAVYRDGMGQGEHSDTDR